MLCPSVSITGSVTSLNLIDLTGIRFSSIKTQKKSLLGLFSKFSLRRVVCCYGNIFDCQHGYVDTIMIPVYVASLFIESYTILLFILFFIILFISNQNEHILGR